jgi:hypothetical protein
LSFLHTDVDSYIWDITNLEAPKNSGYYKSSTRAVDHNQFIHDGLSYQSNYQAGLRILDVSSIPKHPDGSKVKEIACHARWWCCYMGLWYLVALRLPQWFYRCEHD